MKYERNEGSVALLFCGGVGIGQYAIRLRGRWYRLAQEPHQHTGALRNVYPPDHLRALDFGLSRLNEYLDKSRKHFGDLPEIRREDIPAPPKGVVS